MAYVRIRDRRLYHRNYMRDYRKGILRPGPVPQTAEERRGKVRAYYLAHKEECLARSKKWYGLNRKRRAYIARRWELKQYGLTPEAFQKMHKFQKGRCWICSRKMKPAVVDHDHQSGIVRGLLCRSCNQGIGLLNDSALVLRKAIKYLERSPRK